MIITSCFLCHIQFILRRQKSYSVNRYTFRQRGNMQPIHPLIKAARDKKLPHPAQLNKFNQEYWIKFMDQIGPLTAEASAYISGATWLNNNFQSVHNTRKQICFLKGCRPEYHEMIRHISPVLIMHFGRYATNKKRFLKIQAIQL